MIVSFRDQASEDIFNGFNSKVARQRCPRILWRIAARKLDQLDSAISMEELKISPCNRLEGLTGKRKDEHSIRINAKYRICFVWSETGPRDVEITDYH